MKSSLLLYPALLVSVGIASLGAVTSCSKGSGSNPSPSTVKLAISRLQTDGTNTMLYVQVRKTDGGTPAYLLKLGGNSDSYNGKAEVSSDADFPTGQYSFRAWFPDVVANPRYPANPPLRGKVHTELLVNGQVKASLDLDASRPNFERDTCSRTVTVQVQ